MSHFFKFFIMIAMAFMLWSYWLKSDQGVSDAADYQSSEGVHRLDSYSMTNLEPYAGEFWVLSREIIVFGEGQKLVRLILL